MDFLKKLFGGKGKVEKIDLTKRFDLIGRVGQGSMSKVWRARDTRTMRTVALKVLDKEKTKKHESRFTGLKKPGEGEIAMQLKHPNVVQTLEYGLTTQDETFLVMEFIEGVSLSYLVDAQNEQMQKNRLSYMIQLGDGVQYFHDKGFIHRDICPRNVIVGNDGTVKLIDFGLAVPNTPNFQQPGNRTGTANYMAPELVKRQRTDQRIDVFSYAVTCYEMFTRKTPWDSGETLDTILQLINSPAPDIRTLVKDIDAQVANTIMKGLALVPADRWQTAKEMADALRDARARLGG